MMFLEFACGQLHHPTPHTTTHHPTSPLCSKLHELFRQPGCRCNVLSYVCLVCLSALLQDALHPTALQYQWDGALHCLPVLGAVS